MLLAVMMNSRPLSCLLVGVLCASLDPVSLLVGPAGAAERPLDEGNSWAFAQPDDPFSDGAWLDLRGLNEAKAGQSGFVRLSEDGNDFVRGDGEPIRFWAVGTDGWRFTPDEMDVHCRWLAKLGVNLARLHVTVVREDAGIRDLDERVIDGCHRFIKAARDNGIYVLISPFYAHFDAPARWGLEGGEQNAEGLIFFNPAVQDAYRHWTREFYTRVNPHTGLAIRDDPTVAILQIHNEDSLFFWTQQGLAEPQKRLLAARFGEWLATRHGSVEKAFESWGGGVQEHAHDDPVAGVAGVFDVWFLTRDWEGGMAERIRDQTEFMTELQAGFYDAMGRHLRDELGCRQLLNATNWRTANDERLKALERLSYHRLAIDAENEYVGSDYQHQGPNDGYRIDPGDHLVNESVLSKPFEMCTNWKQEDGHPFIVTETAWKNPNRYQSEGPFLVAAYQSLNGIDAVCWFSCQTPRYEEDPLKPFWRTGDQMSTHKWNHCYPAMMAGFPGNALLYRRSDLARADPVVIEARPLGDLWARRPARIADNETYGDQRQRAELEPGWEPEGDRINPVAFLVGPVVSRLGVDAGESVVADLAPYHSAKAGVIRSATGEIAWNYRERVCTMNAPRAQGVAGFLRDAGGRFALDDVTIESANEYATVNVVALDDRPIAESGRVLVQVVTVNRLTGWTTSDAEFTVGSGDGAYAVKGERIERIGRPPFRLENTEVTVTVRNAGLRSATVLDINGYPVRGIEMTGGRCRLPNDAIYVVLHGD